MDYVIIVFVAFGASLLTFYSGFGLGTLLSPVFMLFFPVEVAIALTGMVHLLNNVFKMGLIGRYVSGKVLLRFGLPAIPAAFLGARLLTQLTQGVPLMSWSIGTKNFNITTLNLTIGLLIAAFSLYELLPAFRKRHIGSKWLSLGGILSGFFGGLSGHQGALRSAFLIRMNLGKETYIATGIAIACLVDVTRLSVYSGQYMREELFEQWPYMIAACLSAFIGAFAGRRLIEKITLDVLHLLVGWMLFAMGLGISIGLFGH